jgi:hypothetical protein
VKPYEVEINLNTLDEGCINKDSSVTTSKADGHKLLTQVIKGHHNGKMQSKDFPNKTHPQINIGIDSKLTKMMTD